FSIYSIRLRAFPEGVHVGQGSPNPHRWLAPCLQIPGSCIETNPHRSDELMARAFWKGSISFGLVEIPVRLQPAVQSHDLSFSLLDRKDFSPVGFKRFNKNSGR